jgi:hypothetical protein
LLDIGANPVTEDKLGEFARGDLGRDLALKLRFPRPGLQACSKAMDGEEFPALRIPPIIVLSAQTPR